MIASDPNAPTRRIRLASNGGVGPFLTVNGPRGGRISTWLDLADVTTVRGTSHSTLELTGVLGGAGGLTVNMTDSGRLFLSGNNTFAGGVTLDAGALMLLHERGLGTGGLTVNGGTLVLGTDPSKPVTNDVLANSTLTVQTTLQYGSALNGVISGAGGLTYDGVMVGNTTFSVTTLYLGGANTYTGSTVLNRGNVTLTGAAGALTATGGVTALGTTLRLDNQVANNADRLADAAPVALHAGTLELFGNAAGTSESVGAVTGTGHNTLTITGPSSTPGTLTASSFSRGADRSTWTFGGDRIRLGAGPAADLVGGGGAAGTPTVNILPYAVGTVPSPSAGAAPVTYTEAGGVRMLTPEELVTSLMAQSGQATARNVRPNHSSDLIVGDTAVNSLTTLSAWVSGQGTLTIGSGLLLNASNDTTATIVGVGGLNFGGREGVIVTNNAPLEILSPIAGSNGVTVAALNPTNPVIFSRSNTFAGPLTVNRGRLEFAADAQLGAAGNALALNGGGLLYTGFDATIARPVSLGAATSAGPLDPGNGAVGVAGQTTTLTLAGVVSGPGGVVTRGDAGTVVLANPNNTYSGNTIVNGAAKLHVASDGALGDGGPIILNTGHGRGWLGVTGDFTTSRTIYLASGLSAPWGDRIMTDADLTVAGTIADFTPGVSGVLQKLGAGRLTLTGTNTYHGATVVSAGELVVRGGGSIAASSEAVISNNALLRIDNSAANNNNRVAGRVRFDGGGRLELIGNAAGTSETVGEFNFRDGLSVVRVTPAPGAHASLISLSDFSAGVSTGAMILFAGPDLGAGGAQILMPNNGPGNNHSFGRFDQAFGFDGTSYGMVTNDVAGIRLLTSYVRDWSQAVFQQNVRLSYNAASGTRTLNSLVLDSGGGLAIGAGNSVTLDSGDLLAVAGNTGITGGTLQPLNPTDVLRMYTAGDLTVGSVIGGLRVYKGGAGTLTLSGANTAPSYIAYEGTLRLGAANALPAGAFIYLGPGTTFDLNGHSTTLSSLYSLTPQGVAAEQGVQPSTIRLGTSRLEVVLPNSANMSFASNVTGTTGGLTLSVDNASGDIRVSGPLAYAGDTLIRGGRVYVTHAQPVGGRFVLGDGASTVPASLLFSGYFNYLGGAITEFARPIAVQTAAGQTATVGIQSLGSTNLTLASDVALNGNPLVLRADQGSWLRQTGVISGPGRVEFLAGGLVTLAGNNTYTGGTRLTGTANLDVASDAAFGTGPITYDGTGGSGQVTLRVQSGPRTLANPVAVSGHPNGTGISIIAADDLTLTGPVTVNSATSLGVTGGGIVRLTNTVGGTSSLGKGGGGTLVLSGNNTFNGFTLESGLVVLGSSSAGGAGPLGAGAVTVNPVNPNKGFRAEGADRTLANPVTTYGDFFVDGPRHLTFTGPTTYYWPTGITVRDPGQRTTFSGPVSGAGQLTKLGPGTVVLSNAAGNSYTGNTVVSAGTLEVANTSGSATGTGAVIVEPGATLAGTGSLVPNKGSQAANAVAVRGRVAPGPAVGMLDFGDAASLATVTLDGRYGWDLSASGASAGRNTGGSSAAGSHDRLTVQGALTLGPTWKLDPSFIGGSFDPARPYSWAIATASGGVTGPTADALGAVGFPDLRGGTFDLAIVGPGDSVLVLNFTPVPEPATALGVAAGALSLAGLARRLRRG